MKPVGYLIKSKDGLEGERGAFYDYLFAGNGVFVEAEAKLLAARVPVALGEIRGLAPAETQVVLRHGLIPKYLFELALNAMLADSRKERYIAVTWDNGYHLYVPEQAGSREELAKGNNVGHGSGAFVAYVKPDNVILDLHSHGHMTPWFSGEDNRDEQGFRIYGVIGRLDKRPKLRLRVGAYGYYGYISWSDVFDGSSDGIDEINEEPTEEEINMALGKEVMLDVSAEHWWQRIFGQAKKRPGALTS